MTSNNLNNFNKNKILKIENHQNQGEKTEGLLISTNIKEKKKNLQGKSFESNSANGYSLQQMDDFSFKRHDNEPHSSKINVKNTNMSGVNLKLFEKIEQFQRKHFKQIEPNNINIDSSEEKADELTIIPESITLKRVSSGESVVEDRKEKEKRKKIY